MTFVSTSKFSAKVICNGEHEKFTGINFSTLIFPYLLLAD